MGQLVPFLGDQVLSRILVTVINQCKEERGFLAILFGVVLTIGQNVAVGQYCDYASTLATAPARRFIDNHDGTVTDLGTGLQWKRCSEGQIWMGSFCDRTATTHSWQGALNLADGATYAGKDDWRLPNVKELASIIEEACYYPAFNETVFPDTPGADVWTSSSVAPISSNYRYSEWLVEPNHGEVIYGGFLGGVVRLVRGTPAAGALNDTGLDWWALEGWGAGIKYLSSEPPDYPGQDASYGRDATHDDDVDGHAGFSFTKLDAGGNPLSTSSTSWSCVADGVTGLVWETKTDDGGLHDRDWYYSWYSSDFTTNGGDAGASDGTDVCYDPTRCDTEKFVADVNSAGLCGHSDWRLPTRTELLSIVDFSRFAPAIDTNYFPDTGPGNWYWSSSPWTYSTDGRYAVWYIDFEVGTTVAKSKASGLHVRLIRNGSGGDAPVTPIDATAQVNGNWSFVDAPSGYVGAVVIAGPPSYHGPTPAWCA